MANGRAAAGYCWRPVWGLATIERAPGPLVPSLRPVSPGGGVRRASERFNFTELKG